MQISGKMFLYGVAIVAVGVIVGTWINRESQRQIAKSKATKIVKNEPSTGDTVVV